MPVKKTKLERNSLSNDLHWKKKHSSNKYNTSNDRRITTALAYTVINIEQSKSSFKWIESRLLPFIYHISI